MFFFFTKIFYTHKKAQNINTELSHAQKAQNALSYAQNANKRLWPLQKFLCTQKNPALGVCLLVCVLLVCFCLWVGLQSFLIMWVFLTLFFIVKIFLNPYYLWKSFLIYAHLWESLVCFGISFQIEFFIEQLWSVFVFWNAFFEGAIVLIFWFMAAD